VIIGDPNSPSLPDGRYRATLAAGSEKDYADNAQPSDVVIDFFSLRADANHDGTVDTLDFNALAAKLRRHEQELLAGRLQLRPCRRHAGLQRAGGQLWQVAAGFDQLAARRGRNCGCAEVVLSDAGRRSGG
jgi:hypothetical protein